MKQSLIKKLQESLLHFAILKTVYHEVEERTGCQIDDAYEE